MEQIHQNLVFITRVMALIKMLAKVLIRSTLVKINLFTLLFASSGIMALVHMGIGVTAGTVAGPVQRMGRLVRHTKHPHIIMALQGQGKRKRVPNIRQSDILSSDSWGEKWSTEDFIIAHNLVRLSGKCNFEGCRIPIPTSIRYDRLAFALGDDVTPKEQRVLSLLKFGMPIDCKSSFGCKKVQKNHYSAVSFDKEVSDYFAKGVESQALLGPFELPPICNLRYSPLMSVPKEVASRRVIVDFSFPPRKFHQ